MSVRTANWKTRRQPATICHWSIQCQTKKCQKWLNMENAHVAAPQPPVVFHANPQQPPVAHNNRQVFYGGRRSTLTDQIRQFVRDAAKSFRRYFGRPNLENPNWFTAMENFFNRKLGEMRTQRFQPVLPAVKIDQFCTILNFRLRQRAYCSRRILARRRGQMPQYYYDKYGNRYLE